MLRYIAAVATGLSISSNVLAADKPLVEPLSYGNALSVIGSLLVVLALLFVAAWILRRGQGLLRHQQGPIEVVSQLSLGVKEKVLLLRVGEENILVGCAPGNVRQLHVWHGELPPSASPPVASTGFVEQLRQQMSMGNKTP